MARCAVSAVRGDIMIYKKIYSWSIFLTALFSFEVWHLVNLIENIPVNDHNLQIIIKFAVGAFFSFGFFIGMVSLFYLLIEKFKFIKKLFFASSYIEGVWLCFGIPEDKKIVLIIQQIEQTPDKVSIYGQKFDYNNGNPTFRGSISSTSASLDDDKHLLNSTYISDKKDKINAGFSSFQLISKGKKAPDMFFGYSSNFSHGKRSAIGKRYCDYDKMPDLKEIVKEAKRFYEDQKELFDNIECNAGA